MRKGVLGSIAALTAGTGLALGQGPAPAGGYGLLPASGQVAPVPPGGLGIPAGLAGPVGPDCPPVLPAGEPAPNGAPGYPPPGPYGATPYQLPKGDWVARSAAPHWWVSGEYLLWWVKNQPSRFPYITTGARAEGGVIGRPTTTILVGDCDLGYGLMSGGRITGGWFRDADRRYGFEISAFLLEQKSVQYYAQSDANGVPVIARPFVDAATGAQGVLTVAFPNLASGSVLFKTTTQSWGAEGSGVVNLYRNYAGVGAAASIDGLVGVRYFELAEDIDITSSSTLLGASTTTFAGLTVNAPATITVSDRIETTNRFYGGQVGYKAESWSGKWYFASVGKIAFGVMNQTLLIDGRSDVLDPTRGIAAVNPGGLLAGPSNICNIRNDEFAVIPEMTTSIGYNWGQCFTTFIGYNVIYVSRVLRPADQVTNVLNPALIPTSPTFGLGGAVETPNVRLTQTDFWLQGVNFGFLVKY